MANKVKRFSGAPFGTQKARFDISAVHPQNKMPGTFTEVPYCRVATSRESRMRGPGSYNVETGAFTDRAIRAKSAGPNWKQAFDSARLSAIPHILYKQEWEHKRLLKDQMGPGRYAFRDFIDEIDSHPASHRGVCQTTGFRLRQENKFQASLPGPGTYGDGGIPSARLDDKNMKSFCTVGVMEGSSERSENICKEGSGLAPGSYNNTSSINEVVNRVVSKLGPYDITTGARIPANKHDAANSHRSPCSYEIQPFTAILDDHHHKMKGHFGTIAQYPMPPTERVYCSTLSQCPRRRADPGPGWYSFKSAIQPATKGHYPFDSSAARFRKFPTKNTTPVGPGQYSLHRWLKAQHRNCNEWVFKTAISRLPLDVCSPRELLLNERVHPKRVHEHYRPGPAMIIVDSPLEGVRT